MLSMEAIVYNDDTLEDLFGHLPSERHGQSMTPMRQGTEMEMER